MTPESAEIGARLAAVRQRIEAVDRSHTHVVEITAVTKTFPPATVAAAVEAGCSAIGENYASDLLTKRDLLDSLDAAVRPRVDFIGQLQSNKVRQLVGVVDRWCTVDRVSLVRELAKRTAGAEVLIQVDTTGEPGKGGCAEAQVPALLERCSESGLSVLGLLTVGPTIGGPEAAAPGFDRVRRLADELGLDVCSMGMTGDLEVAVAAGATNVRVGSAIFGPRPAAADHTHVHPDGGGRG
ncbi:MAG: YggS family pyridoxal phosphate enzyme [Ilumatobacter sp.]